MGKSLFLPIFYLRGKRWRIRVRLVSGGPARFERWSDRYTEGVVHSVKLWPFFVVALVD